MRGFPIIFILFVVALPLEAKVEEPFLLSISGGVFNLIKDKKSANFQIECRSNFSLYREHKFFIRPVFGYMRALNSSSYLYGGLAFDLMPSPHIVISPSFSPGVYMKGQGMDLGYALEFKTTLEIAYRFNNRSRIGVMFYHLSNANIGKKNPGTECLMLVYSIPIF